MVALEIITVIGVIAVIVLFIVLRKRRSFDVIQELVNKRRESSKIATRADFVQGNQRLPVALALTDTQLFYENADLQANLELHRIEEVEYDDELLTGKEVEDGRVLRLRSHGTAFEFILSRPDAERFASLLPAHRLDEPGSVRVV